MVGDVDREGGGCAAGKANAFFGTRGVEIEHGEPATLFREAQRDGPADAAAATGDKGDLILQSAECHAGRSAADASAHVLAEFGLALLQEGAHPFARLLGVVVERQRLHAHPAQRANAFGIGVERALGDGDGRGAAFQNLGAHFATSASS